MGRVVNDNARRIMKIGTTILTWTTAAALITATASLVLDSTWAERVVRLVIIAGWGVLFGTYLDEGWVPRWQRHWTFHTAWIMVCVGWIVLLAGWLTVEVEPQDVILLALWSCFLGFLVQEFVTALGERERRRDLVFETRISATLDEMERLFRELEER
jgi:hypothetical protein